MGEKSGAQGKAASFVKRKRPRAELSFVALINAVLEIGGVAQYAGEYYEAESQNQKHS